MRNPVRLPRALRNRATAVTVAGAAVALVGVGTASAATVVSTSHPAHTPTVHAQLVEAKKHAAATAAAQVSARPAAAPAPQSWSQIQQQVGSQQIPADPAANQLNPVGTDGAQNAMPISGDQMANATTIVQQALAKKMGVRSAVIAVATAMQESQLQNINYGTSDSLGLFQQRPSMGWGTAQQILDPAYSADAFLAALQQYQGSNPGWATQPLWSNAQAVQKSGVPFAYAQWEAQASQLVQQIVTQVK
jgi:hypothetical protein